MRNLSITLLLCISSYLSGQTIDLPDGNWRLWVDTAAVWENDLLFLPEEVNFDSLPVNPPTQGWQQLNPNNGIPVTLPSTVEQHYWGSLQNKKYKNAYVYEATDDQVSNGSYQGVSWWYTSIDVPKNLEGKRFTFFLRSARLRAEVFINEKLAGYHLIGETSYECDITPYIQSGETNKIAIRITNPGGRFDWNDTFYWQWGNYEFHSSHGFGGLDRGCLIKVHDPLHLNDVWVANNPDINTITVHGSIINATHKNTKGDLNISILNTDGEILVERKYPFFNGKNTNSKFQKSILVDDVRYWSPDSPVQYIAKVTLDAKHYTDSKSTKFGFRWFTAEGIGSNAMLTLNNHRIRLISSISWSFWGYNGLWPNKEYAIKEVKVAKQLGHNTLHFHRNIGRTDLFEAQDSLGLLRYMEPGGGFSALGKEYKIGSFDELPLTVENPDTSAAMGEASTFAEKYMEEKLIRMVKDFRRHPSLIMYTVQNEIAPDMRNPRIYHILRRMHKEDPSRIVALKSGVPIVNQAWMLPYSSEILYDKGNGYNGWADQHTVGGPGVWKDYLYTSVDSFTHKTDIKDEITVWGEMLGCAVPDNHAQMIREINKNGGSSYDLKDHQEIDNAYAAFLTQWKMNDVWPTTNDLYTELGRKSYEFWKRIVETARLSDENDFLVVSGWESTAIENHSGVVDNLRNPKSDPTIFRLGLEAERAVVRLKNTVFETGQTVNFDVWYLNENQSTNPQSLKVSLIDPHGKPLFTETFEVPRKETNVFSYLIKEGGITLPLQTWGEHTFEVYTVNNKLSTRETIWVVPSIRKNKWSHKSVGIVGSADDLIHYLNDNFEINAEKYNGEKDYDLIIEARDFGSRTYAKVEMQGTIKNTDDPALYQTEQYGSSTMRFDFSGLPKDSARVTLKYAELYCKSPKQRLFDVAINNKIVEDNFDLFSEGARLSALDKTYNVYLNQGTVGISFPEVKANMAKICAIKIETKDTVIAVNIGGKAYQDASGLVWHPYQEEAFLADGVAEKVKAGTPLFIAIAGAGSADIYSRILYDNEISTRQGYVGEARAPWMGSWVFVGENALFKHLPTKTVMDKYYQVGALDANGLLVDGDIEVIAGFGRDHDRNIGAASLCAKMGKGTVVLHGYYGMVPSAAHQEPKMQQTVVKKLYQNVFDYLFDSNLDK